MLRGYIDAVSSAGLIEGWAYDEEKPLEPLYVAIVDPEGIEVASGVANLYRRDLAEANHGYGWCHFRLRVAEELENREWAKLQLLATPANIVIHTAEGVIQVKGASYEISTIEDLLASDPTIVTSLDQIENFEEIFNSFIRLRGVDAFVRAAYVYVLSRSIDDEGIVLYSRLIRQARLSPYAMLRTLADSAEFRERPRSLIAPTQPGFPFRVS